MRHPTPDRSDSRPRRCRRRGPALALLRLVLALSALGCNLGRSAGGNPTPRTPVLAGVDTIEASLEGGWITVRLDLPRKPEGPKPVVITPVIDKRALLERGIGVVEYRTHYELLAGLSRLQGLTPGTAPSPPPTPPPTPTPAASPTPTPTTVGGWLLAAPRPGIVGQAYFSLITENAHKTVPKVVSYLSTVPQVDSSRIAITGSSTSGFVALEAMAQDPRIAAAVVLVACGDYFTFLRSSSLGLADNPEWLVNGEAPLDPAYAAWLREIQPNASVDRFPPRPLLYMVGARDRAIPIACAEHTAEALGRAYAKAGVPGQLDFNRFEEGTHGLVPGYQQIVQRWLEDHLLRGH